MKKVIIIVGVVVAMFAILVTAMSMYLGVDDLAQCSQTPTGSAACSPADAIVAVSGGDTAARTNEAIKLYQNGWAKYIIFSGAAADKSGPSNAAVMKRQAVSAGVPTEAILLETRSETTEQNAANTAQLLNKHAIKTVILVTSAYHQRRAAIEFQKSAPSITVRSHPVAEDRQWHGGGWWLTPTGWSLALQEIVKIMVAKG